MEFPFPANPCRFPCSSAVSLIEPLHEDHQSPIWFNEKYFHVTYKNHTSKALIQLPQKKLKLISERSFYNNWTLEQIFTIHICLKLRYLKDWDPNILIKALITDSSPTLWKSTYGRSKISKGIIEGLAVTCKSIAGEANPDRVPPQFRRYRPPKNSQVEFLNLYLKDGSLKYKLFSLVTVAPFRCSTSNC